MEHKYVIMYINTHLKGVLIFIGFSDLGFLLIVEIWHTVQKVSGSTLISIFWQRLTVSPYISDLLDLCSNLWWNNSRENFFLRIFDFNFSLVFTKNASFLCTLYGNDTAFYWLALKKTTQNTLWRMQGCIEFINVIMENI